MIQFTRPVDRKFTDMLHLFVENLLTVPILLFILGIILSILQFRHLFSPKIHKVLTIFLLFAIGFKGGASLMEHSHQKMLVLMGVLILWGFIQPFFSYFILRRFTKVDAATAAAIAACFGSISVMTYVAGTVFLEKEGVPYDGFLVAVLAVMEVPAIVSGLLISKLVTGSGKSSLSFLIKETFLNKTVLTLLVGMFLGAVCHSLEWNAPPRTIHFLFKPCLSLFLFNMGWIVGTQRNQLKQFSLSLILFGIYTPLIGACFGIFLSSLFGLDTGSSTLVCLLCASASYIAVPAAMKIALPEAREAIYLPLSLAITFPFNVLIGIPLYYEIALKIYT